MTHLTTGTASPPLQGTRPLSGALLGLPMAIIWHQPLMIALFVSGNAYKSTYGRHVVSSRGTSVASILSPGGKERVIIIAWVGLPALAERALSMSGIFKLVLIPFPFSNLLTVE
jgi:hypothetical protein